MDRRKFEDIVEDLRGEGLNDLADELEKGYSGSSLRRQLEEAKEQLAEVPDLRKRVEAFERGDKVKDALASVDIDYESLSKAERRAVETAEVDFEDEEQVRQLVTELELVASEDTQGGEEEPAPPASEVVKQARRAPSGDGAKTTITPEDYAGWDKQERLAYRANNPEKFAALKRGETVTAS